jgi:serine/threonine-protein kinase
MQEPRTQPAAKISPGRVWPIVKVMIGGGLVIAGMFVSAAIGGFLVLRYSARPSEIEVPDFIGITEDAARARAAERDIKLKLVGERSDRRIARGLILDQDPSPGSWVKAGRTVRVVRSLGEARIEVPELVGRAAREARLELQRLGLRVGMTTYARLPLPEDRVVSQQPRGGEMRSKGEPVDILVSRGARSRVYVMPDLVGRSLEAIRNVLEKAGLRVAGERRAYREGVPPGIVLAQRPAPGGPVRESQAVTLTVSQ